MASDGTLASVMSKEGFNPENFVKKISKSGTGDLESFRDSIQSMQDETALSLKQNVYKNYAQFIDTAKEISILETELYQLSHMLTDQKSIMTTLLELSITGNNKVETPQEPEPPEEDNQQKSLAFLLEKVEGCSSVTAVPGRTLIHDGALTSIDHESFTPIQRVHCFLLNDSLMIAERLPHRRGPVKYAFQSIYELDSFAVVNARDMGNCRNAFKILMFPETYMFMAESAKAKRQWLEILEETKKKKLVIQNQRKEAAQDRLGSRSSMMRLHSMVGSPSGDLTPSGDPHFAKMGSRFSSFSLTDSTNPFSEEDDDSTATDDQVPASVLEVDFLTGDWIQELPEDLDVCIAQRDFEGAVDHIIKVNDYLQGCPKSPAIREYRARIELRVKSLTEVLINELQVTPERSLRGGPRAARKAVTQLIRLRKSAQACDLFLKNRSLITKYHIQQLKIEGDTPLYVKQLCKVFFSNMKDTGQEFLKAFPDHHGCFSTFVVWAREELNYFIKLFTSQVFTSKSNISNVADCVNNARSSCQQLTDIGLELMFVLDGMLLTDLKKIITDSSDLQIDAVKHRALEDLWRPINYQNSETLKQFESDMDALGFTKVAEFSYGDCFTRLTANFVHFCRSFLTFAGDVLKLHGDDLHKLITDSLTEIIKAQLTHAERSAKSPQFQDPKEQQVIVKNAQFLVECALPLIADLYKQRTGQSFVQMTQFKSSYIKLVKATEGRSGQLV